MDEQRGIKLKILIIWMAILLMSSFWLTALTDSDSVGLTAVPEVPREGEPVITTFKLNNPTSQPITTSYQFYANGELLTEGVATIPPGSSKLYQHVYKNPLELGEQINFMVKTQSEQGNYEKLVSLPPYPPQIWSSFVSFASFSTSVMSSMSTMTYYQSSFDSDIGFNFGLVAAIALLSLLIFLELTRSLIRQKTLATLGRLRIKFSTVTWILFIIFMGMFYTKIVMTLAS